MKRSTKAAMEQLVFFCHGSSRRWIHPIGYGFIQTAQTCLVPTELVTAPQGDALPNHGAHQVDFADEGLPRGPRLSGSEALRCQRYYPANGYWSVAGMLID